MTKYWEEFIIRYKEIIPYRSLSEILKAFYYFSSLGHSLESVDEIMGYYVLPDDTRTIDEQIDSLVNGK